MSNPAQRRAHGRALSRHGQDMTHVTFSPSGSDDYNDATSDGNTTSTVTGYLRTSRNPWQTREASDVSPHERATIIVDDSVSITDENSDTRADEFHIDHSGDGTFDEKWKVYKADRERSGLTECKVSLIDD